MIRIFILLVSKIGRGTHSKIPIHSLLGLIILVIISSCGVKAKLENKQPNILFAIADDQSFPYASAYGTSGIHTPAFDQVAQKGILFTNAFAAAPQCSPSRAAILTGRNIWQLEEAGTHASYFPKFPVFTDILEKNGYQIGYTGKPWGPGNWKDAGWGRNPVGPPYNEKKIDTVPTAGIKPNDYFSNFKSFYNQKPANKSFFFWYGGHEPHRVYEFGSGAKHGGSIENLSIPKFLPDNEIVRHDISDYIFEIQWFDHHLGKMLKFLEENGELENTIVVVTADNGMPFPYAKANLQEFGTHIPLAICWPNKIKSNKVVDDLISLIDIAPTFLDLINLKDIPEMTGKSFSALVLKNPTKKNYLPRDYIFTGRERHTHAREDNLGYPVRAIHSKEYLYVLNLKPDRWPVGAPVANTWKNAPANGDYKEMWPGFHDVDGSPSKMLLMNKKTQFPFLYELAFGKRPQEQLYELKNDPYCINNIAKDPNYLTIKSKLKKILETELKSQGDPRMYGSDIFDSYPRVSSMREFKGFKDRGAYNPEYMENGQMKVK